MRSLSAMPAFSHQPLTRRAATIDVCWFNDRFMPHSLFEVEHSTDFQNSLLKFHDLQNFCTRMVIVAAPSRRTEFQHRAKHPAFQETVHRLAFYDYESLARDFEYKTLKSTRDFAL